MEMEDDVAVFCQQGLEIRREQLQHAGARRLLALRLTERPIHAVVQLRESRAEDPAHPGLAQVEDPRDRTLVQIGSVLERDCERLLRAEGLPDSGEDLSEATGLFRVGGEIERRAL